MLYPDSHSSGLSPELFRSPSREYRAAPFWAWNGKLSKERLTEQIQYFKKMGLGGFHMHVRTGMDSPYLGREFMEYVQHCVRTAKQMDMLAWLYDEDRWPSGSAGGRVTDGKPENARKSLLFTVTPYEESNISRSRPPEPGRGQENNRQENGHLLAVYDVLLNNDGTLKHYSRVSPDSPAADGAVRWYAYMEYASNDPWFNNHAYVDTLDPRAIAEFIHQTHETYEQFVGDSFGTVIPAIFTDEPQFTPKLPLAFALEQRDAFLPWTAALPVRYQELYQENLLDFLPEMFWELPDQRLSPIRWRFQNLVTELFVKNYCMQISAWCSAHHLLLTGHVMGESSLYDQTQAIGDAMRCYRAFDIPGIDILCDFHEYTTAKQTQSSVRQLGSEGMLSELYGVTGWNYDFRGYKLQGDWQAALGVTVRVPHLALMTLKGEAKRDYPASINYQSPWWEEFSMIEDHFSRLNTALTRGKAVVSVAVVHPIESYWLYWGPSDQTAALREEMDQQFSHLAEILLFNSIDFDYLCEAELPSLCAEGSFPLAVGQMSYRTIIVPPVRTLRSSTLERLEGFVNGGGKLLFLGDCPDYIDALPSDAAKGLYQKGICTGFQDSAILNALEQERFLDIRREDGSREKGLLHQLRREENGSLWLFICNGKNPETPDVDTGRELRFILNGTYTATLYNTLTGEIHDLPVRHSGTQTILERRWYIHDSLLLLLKKTEQITTETTELPDEVSLHSFADILLGEVPVTLTEPNMLLLDMAEYSFNGGEYFSQEELLRIDNQVRTQLGIPIRRKEVVQPYLLKPEVLTNYLQLRFRIYSEIPLQSPMLALEEPQAARIMLNGYPVSNKTEGNYFVDKDIPIIALPDFVTGENILEVKVPIGQRTNLEYFYLLGNFGVRINGTKKTIISPVSRIGWGDLAGQNLPFYTGNVLYHTRIFTEGDFSVRVPQYRGGLVKVLVDGKDSGNIAFSPYTLTVHTQRGEHSLDLMLYGTRHNGFGQLHHTPGIYFYQSPNSWRSAGDFWSYEYHFKPSGILKSPELRGAVFLDETGHSRRCGAMAVHITDRS